MKYESFEPVNVLSHVHCIVFGTYVLLGNKYFVVVIVKFGIAAKMINIKIWIISGLYLWPENSTGDFEFSL